MPGAIAITSIHHASSGLGSGHRTSGPFHESITSSTVGRRPSIWSSCKATIGRVIERCTATTANSPPIVSVCSRACSRAWSPADARNVVPVKSTRRLSVPVWNASVIALRSGSTVSRSMSPDTERTVAVLFRIVETLNGLRSTSTVAETAGLSLMVTNRSLALGGKAQAQDELPTLTWPVLNRVSYLQPSQLSATPFDEVIERTRDHDRRGE